MTMDEHCRDLKSWNRFRWQRRRNTEKNVRSARRANRYAFRINICSIHDGTLLWMHPSSHSHTYINKHVFALVSPVPFFFLSLSSDFCHSYMTRLRPPRFTATCQRRLSADCEFWRPNWQNNWPWYLFMTE